MKIEPNVNFIIGAQRSGTTYLYKQLDQHPDICMSQPMRPEPKFFLNKNEIEKGGEYYLDKYFFDRRNGQILVEKSTSYIESIEAGKRINVMFPRAKILVMLRNPVDRAISNYFFSKEHGLETRSLEEIFIEGKQPPKLDFATSVSPFDYIKRGQYIDYLNDYIYLFGSNNIKIIIFEKLIGNLKEFQDIYSFLEVDNRYIPENLDQKINSSYRELLTNSTLKKTLKNHFSQFNEKLSSLLNIELDVWNS